MDKEKINERVVFIVDDNTAIRDSVRWLVQQVGLKPKTFNSAQEFLNSYNPDIRGCLVLDIRMPGMSGLELQDKLAKLESKLPIIIITGHGDIPITVRAMKAGAYEFLQKPFNDQSLLDAIQGGLDKYEEIWRLDDKRKLANQSLSSLTPREREVLELLRQGKSNKLIARELNLSVRTVEGHRANLVEKIETKSLGQLIELVIKSDDSL